jgi:hypothetical protein
MEEGEFPGWGTMIVCVLAALIPAFLINSMLPESYFIVGLAVGAVLAGLAISALCGMSVKRASIAAGIYLAIQTGISLLLNSMIQET